MQNNKRKLRRRDKSSRRNTMISLRKRDLKLSYSMRRSLRNLRFRSKRWLRNRNKTRSVSLPLNKLRTWPWMKALSLVRRSRNKRKDSKTNRKSFLWKNKNLLSCNRKCSESKRNKRNLLKTKRSSSNLRSAGNKLSRRRKWLSSKSLMRSRVLLMRPMRFLDNLDKTLSSSISWLVPTMTKAFR